MYRIDNQSRQAVYEQIVHQVEQYVLAGVLTSGEKMPSVRRLSIELNVNPNTVQRAYTELERNNVIVTAPGRGAFVSEGGSALLRERRGKMLASNLKTVISGLRQSGVEKDEIISLVDAAYEEGRANCTDFNLFSPAAGGGKQETLQYVFPLPHEEGQHD